MLLHSACVLHRKQQHFPLVRPASFVNQTVQSFSPAAPSTILPCDASSKQRIRSSKRITACCALPCLLQAAHAALFPIDYDDAFFHKATNGLDRSVGMQPAAFQFFDPHVVQQLGSSIHVCCATVS